MHVCVMIHKHRPKLAYSCTSPPNELTVARFHELARTFITDCVCPTGRDPEHTFYSFGIFSSQVSLEPARDNKMSTDELLKMGGGISRQHVPSRPKQVPNEDDDSSINEVCILPEYHTVNAERKNIRVTVGVEDRSGQGSSLLHTRPTSFLH